jgi:hypothetical protein
MITNYSPSELMHFVQEGTLEKDEMAELLPSEPRSIFLTACEQVEKDLTRACAAEGDFCLASGCALEGESCLNALLNAAPAYKKACGDIWLPLFRSSRQVG